MESKRCVRCSMKYPGHKLSCKIPVEEWRLPTALEHFEEYFRGSGYSNQQDLVNWGIEFAKLHVQEALKDAASKYKWDETHESDNPSYLEQSILNAYPLNKIQ